MGREDRENKQVHCKREMRDCQEGRYYIPMHSSQIAKSATQHMLSLTLWDIQILLMAIAYSPNKPARDAGWEKVVARKTPFLHFMYHAGGWNNCRYAKHYFFYFVRHESTKSKMPERPSTAPISNSLDPAPSLVRRPPSASCVNRQFSNTRELPILYVHTGGEIPAGAWDSLDAVCGTENPPYGVLTAGFWTGSQPSYQLFLILQRHHSK